MVQHLISSFLQRKLFSNACYKDMRNRSISICNLLFILATYFWLEKYFDLLIFKSNSGPVETFSRFVRKSLILQRNRDTKTLQRI